MNTDVVVPSVPVAGTSETQASTPIPTDEPVNTGPIDPTAWSKDEKYDCEAFLEAPYKKHLGRHANK